MSTETATPEGETGGGTSTEEEAEGETAPGARAFAFAMALLAGSYDVVGAVALSGMVHAELLVGEVATMLAVIVLPVASVVLSFAGVLPQYPWWVWWLVVPLWLTTLSPLSPLFLRRVGEWDSDEQWDALKTVLTFGVKLVAIVVVGGIAVALGFSTQQGAELVAASIMPVYPLPVALFTPYMDFSAGVWVLVVVIWYVFIKIG